MAGSDLRRSGRGARLGRALATAMALAVLIPVGVLWPQDARAQQVELVPVAADVAAINRMTRQVETLEVMRQEGIAQGKMLGVDLFGDAENVEWRAALDRVYDTGRMARIYDAALSEVLARDPALAADVTPFLDSELGSRIVALELEARRTTQDEVALGAAREVLAEMEQSDKARRAQIERLVVAADLMESNVMAGLNGNLAFYQAMAAAGAPGMAANEGELLAQVWSQEADIRASTAEFLYPLMALAYAPLTDDELQSYVAFSESPAGLRFNAAMTQAFAPVMIDLSRSLGAEAGRMMSGQVL